MASSDDPRVTRPFGLTLLRSVAKQNTKTTTRGDKFRPPTGTIPPHPGFIGWGILGEIVLAISRGIRHNLLENVFVRC